MENWKEYAILNTSTGDVAFTMLGEFPKFFTAYPSLYVKVDNCEYLAERGNERVYAKDHALIQAQLAKSKISMGFTETE